MANKITVMQLKALKTTDKGKRISEGGGFFGRVTVAKDGSVSVPFYFHFRWGTGTRDYGCGSWPETELAAIREACEDARKMVRAGNNPIEARAAVRAAEAAEREKAKEKDAADTVKGFFALWKKKVLKDRTDGGAELERALEKDAWPFIGKMPVVDVRRTHLLDILDAIKQRGSPSVANKVLGYLIRLFDYAVKRELILTNPAALLTRKDDGGGADGERDRVLVAEELRALLAVLAGGQAGLTLTMRHALPALLGTGARSGELLRARTAHVDLQARTWYIPPENSKTGKEHLVYLSDFVLPHFEALLNLAGASEWLVPDPRDTREAVQRSMLINATADRQQKYYPGRKTDGRSLNYANALLLGKSRWTPHDLRRSAATAMGDLGISPDTIDRCLNHAVISKVRRTYQRQVQWEEQKAAWVRLGQHLEYLSEPNVIPFTPKNSA
jgi:integrase